ncbi:hypothetical protein ACFV0L_10480 [Streptosporangium canum]|uniref:hypothetical protein n=1 Tax=Streptosporangium canum TaxID=324952 RepID=UPI0036C76BAC
MIRKVFHPVTVIAATFALMRKEGWISKKDADLIGGSSTAEKVVLMFRGSAAYSIPEVTERDTFMANDAVAWLMKRRQEAQHERIPPYERQVAAVLDHCLQEGGVNIDGHPHWDGSTVHNYMGTVASAAVVYRDGVPKDRRKRAWGGLIGSRAVGEVGDVLTDFVVTVTHVKTKGPKLRGERYVTEYDYKLLDELGNAYKWFGTSTQMGEGSKVLIKRGRIVRHEDYRGVMFTVLTRCKADHFMTHKELARLAVKKETN